MRFAPLVSLVLLAASGSARAQCPQPYTLDGVLTDLAAIEDGLRMGDDAGASAASAKMETGLGCLNEILPVMIIGRAYRAIGAGKISGGDVDGGKYWFRTATQVEQNFSYGLEDLPEQHPVRGHYEDAKFEASGEIVLMEDMSFIDGNHWVDGRKQSKPQGRLERPHLYQLEGGGQVMSWVILGNGYPPDVLKAGVAVADAGGGGDEAVVVGGGKAPKEPKAPKAAKAPKPDKVASDNPDKPAKEKKPKELAATSSDGTMVVQRQRPAKKTPLLIAGGAIVAGAGGIYFASTQARNKFDNATSLEEIEKLQGSTNQLVIVSAATLAVGTGTLTWGAILDGGGSPLPALQIRF